MNFSDEIKRLGIWEKVVEVSEFVGFKASSIEQAKIEIAKGMARFGLVLYKISEFEYRLVNIHNSSESVEMFGGEKDTILLELFNVVITKSTTIQSVNTVDEAKSKLNEMIGTRNNSSCGLYQLLEVELGQKLLNSKKDRLVSPSRLGPIYRKIEVLGWDKAEFKKYIYSVLNISDEKQMSNDQCTTIIDYLAEKEANITTRQ